MRSYVYGSYVDELLAILPASGVVGERKFVHANHLYSVAALTDNTGAVVERYRYDAYGQRIVLAGDGVTLRWGSSYGNQVGFTGRYEDRETKLWYFRARYYSGSLGRFVGRDPAKYIDGKNLYAAWFVPNFLDPSGMVVTCGNNRFPGSGDSQDLGLAPIPCNLGGGTVMVAVRKALLDAESYDGPCPRKCPCKKNKMLKLMKAPTCWPGSFTVPNPLYIFAPPITVHTTDYIATGILEFDCDTTP